MAVATIFHQEKGVCTFAKCFFFFAQKKKKNVTIFRVPVLRTHWPFCSVAEQHANTQSAICEADTLVIRYSSTLVMVWVSWFSYPLQHGKNGKYEFILFWVFFLSLSLFLYPQIPFSFLWLFRDLKNGSHVKNPALCLCFKWNAFGSGIQLCSILCIGSLVKKGLLS